MATKTTRFSGADWSDQLRTINIIGVGGIGSWTALNLSRIGHKLMLIDPDEVDETNVTGGQMYRRKDIGHSKCSAIESTCRDFGATSPIYSAAELYSPDYIFDYGDDFTEDTDEMRVKIVVLGLDNMSTRKEVFSDFKRYCEQCTEEENKKNILIDGRLNCEMWEIFTIQGNNKDAMDKYENSHLFTDAESEELDCTNKQSTFGAMSISSAITATLCNFLTNEKLGMDFREVPFYQRLYMPIFKHEKEEVIPSLELSPAK